MFKHECLGLFCIIKHFPHHMVQMLIQLTDIHTNAEHKESICAENGTGPQTQGWDPRPPIIITNYVKLTPHFVAV